VNGENDARTIRRKPMALQSLIYSVIISPVLYKAIGLPFIPFFLCVKTRMLIRRLKAELRLAVPLRLFRWFPLAQCGHALRLLQFQRPNVYDCTLADKCYSLLCWTYAYVKRQSWLSD